MAQFGVNNMMSEDFEHIDYFLGYLKKKQNFYWFIGWDNFASSETWPYHIYVQFFGNHNQLSIMNFDIFE